MQSIFRKILSVLTALIMFLSVLPVMALSDDPGNDNYSASENAQDKKVFTEADKSSTVEIWDGTIAEGFEGGKGTYTEPYLISNGAQLAYLAQEVNNGNTYSNFIFRMTADIKLNDTSDWQNWADEPPANIWTAIGADGNHEFNGVFDGGNFTVSGIYINIKKPDSGYPDDYSGLFGDLENGKVKNLNIAESYIKGVHCVGSIAGSTGGYIVNCHNSGTVTGTTFTGGIVGTNSDHSFIADSSNTGSVSSDNIAGGITSYNSGVVFGCYNTGNVTSAGDGAGGIAAYNYIFISPPTIALCFNTGTVTGNNNAGGITARNTAYIANCCNTGKIRISGVGSSYTGGITALNSITSKKDIASVRCCYNTGIIENGKESGGVIGLNGRETENGTVYDAVAENLYYLDESCINGNSIGTALSAAQMEDATNFAGFDFEKIWSMSSGPENYKNPKLLYFLDQTVIPDVRTHSGDLNAEESSIEEILAKEAAIPGDDTVTQTYQAEPSVQAPYEAGMLSDEYITRTEAYLNYIRFLAKLPPVQAVPELNDKAQHGAVVLAALGYMTHYPPKPEDMPEDFYDIAYSSCQTSNLGAGIDDVIHTIIGCMDDCKGSSNLSSVGHRRWFLNPVFLNTGFGIASTQEDPYPFSVVQSHDENGEGCDFDFVSWPPSGNFPLKLFDARDPWSISINPDKYIVPDPDKINVTLTRYVDGKSWDFNTSECVVPSGAIFPSDFESEFFNFETSYMGIRNCIIFRPDTNEISMYSQIWGAKPYYPCGKFNVSVGGITTLNGVPVALNYDVNLFDTRVPEGGEGYFFESPPALAGWTIEDRDTDGSSWELVNGISMGSIEGMGYIRSDSCNCSTEDNWLISPCVPGGGNVSFGINSINNGQPQHLGIYASTDGGYTWSNELGYFTTDAQVQTCSVDLSQYAGQYIQLAFRHYNSEGDNSVILDAVIVTPGAEPLPEKPAIHTAAFECGDGCTGEPPASLLKYTDALFDLPNQNTLAKPGFRFAGWLDKTDNKFYPYPNPEPESPFIMPNRNVSFRAVWQTEQDADIIGYNVRLNEDIALGFYMSIPQQILDDPNLKMVFSYRDDRTFEVSAAQSSQAILPDGRICRVFYCPMVAKEMTETICAQLVGGADCSTVYADNMNQSIRDYSAVILAKNSPYSQNAQNLVKAMLNYGASAQLFFGYNTDELANSILSENDKIIPDCSFNNYCVSPEGTLPGDIEYIGTSLMLENRVKLRFYFNGNIDGVTFKLNGNPAEPVAKGDLYYIQSEGIKASALDKQVILTVSAGSGEQWSIEYGVFDYACKAANAQVINEPLLTIMKAIYDFHVKADLYIKAPNK